MLRFARRKWEWTAASLNADVRNALPDENGNGGNQELQLAVVQAGLWCKDWR